MKLSKTIELLKMIEEYTYPTGSAAFGLPNPVDNDRFCTKQSFDQVVGAARNFGANVPDDDGYGGARSCKVSVGGQEYHFFVVPEDDIPILKTVTEMMTTACRDFPEAMAKKSFRVLLFSQLRDMLKMMSTETPRNRHRSTWEP
jgi:hypothetical protein